MNKLICAICCSVLLLACTKRESVVPERFATAILGHWVSDSTTYKSTFADGHIEGGTYAVDSSFFQFRSNGTFERYWRSGQMIQDNTGRQGGVYELKDSLITITVTSTPAVYWDGREYNIVAISDSTLLLHRIAFGTSLVKNEAWYKYRKR